MTDSPIATLSARDNLRAFAVLWIDNAARGKPLPPTVVARLDRLLNEFEAEAKADTTPIALHWDRLVMPPTGEDDQTIVACMTDGGRPAALFLSPEQRERLGLELVEPDADACPVHNFRGRRYGKCDPCGHSRLDDCHPKES
jgi:hypothetical protein